MFCFRLLLEHFRIYNYLTNVEYSGDCTLTGTLSERITQLDEIDSEMIDYVVKRGKARAGELAELTGMTVPSIRTRLFQLMASGLVCREKTRDHQVLFSIKGSAKGARGRGRIYDR